MAPPRLRSLTPVVTSLEREVGTAGNVSLGGWLQTFEETPELTWPNNTIVFDRMRKTDGQVASTLRVHAQAIRRTRWSIIGDDVNPVVRRFCEVELGLTPERNGRRRRRRQGITWDPFLGHSLIMLPVGHMAFEQVYEVGDPGPELADVANQLPAKVGHLRKLAPRLPRTITKFDVARDGGLDAIHQFVQEADGSFRDVPIGIERLVMFVNDLEGADWTGTSVLRSAYKHWLIKDILIRLGPLTVERNGMGLPQVEYPAGGDEGLALNIAKNARAGEEAGVAVPDGYKLTLVGVTGSTKDELPLLKYHDEAIGRNALTMVLDLGHDNGARSLGDTFAALLAQSQNATIANVEETVTEHVIRDLVAANFGEDEAYPELVGEEVTPETAITPEGLKQLVEAEVILPDRELEADQRRRYGLPPLPPVEDFEAEGVDDPHDRNSPTSPPPPPPPPALGPGAPPAPNMPPGATAPTQAALAARADAVRRRLERRGELTELARRQRRDAGAA